jgi:hypothetical protein
MVAYGGGWSGRVLLAAGVAVALCACGSDEPPPPGDAGASIADALPGTPAEVEEALLTVDDLGEEWIDLGAIPLDERGFDACPETQVVTAGDDPDRRGEAQSLYAQGEPPEPIFGESVSLWVSEDVARERLAEFASMTTECASFEHELPDGGSASVRMLQQDAPRLGDEAVAMLMEYDPSEGPTILRDTTAVRIGDALVLTEGPDLTEDDPEASRQRQRFIDVTRQAVEKATRTLP